VFCSTLRCQAAGQSVGEQHCRCAQIRTVRYSYRNLQHSCNILSAEHQQCEPIREQNSNYSAIWLVCMVGSVVTWSCKNAANHCNVADWLSHGLSCDPSCAGICSVQSRNLRPPLQAPSTPSTLHSQQAEMREIVDRHFPDNWVSERCHSTSCDLSCDQPFYHVI